jgi:hypothetical protein
MAMLAAYGGWGWWGGREANSKTAKSYVVMYHLVWLCFVMTSCKKVLNIFFQFICKKVIKIT